MLGRGMLGLMPENWPLSSFNIVGKWIVSCWTLPEKIADIPNHRALSVELAKKSKNSANGLVGLVKAATFLAVNV